MGGSELGPPNSTVQYSIYAMTFQIWLIMLLYRYEKLPTAIRPEKTAAIFLNVQHWQHCLGIFLWVERDPEYESGSGSGSSSGSTQEGKN